MSVDGCTFWLVGEYRLPGATAALTDDTARAQQIELIATTCPKCGVAKVLWNGTLIRKLLLFTPTTHPGTTFLIPAFASVQAGKLQIVVASSGRPVKVEGVGLLQG